MYRIQCSSVAAVSDKSDAAPFQSGCQVESQDLCGRKDQVTVDIASRYRGGIAGTVFKLTTSLSGWPSKVLYAFTGKRLCERLQALTYAFRSKKSAEKSIAHNSFEKS